VAISTDTIPFYDGKPWEVRRLLSCVFRSKCLNNSAKGFVAAEHNAHVGDNVTKCPQRAGVK
jgi:hypothetical protein